MAEGLHGQCPGRLQAAQRAPPRGGTDAALLMEFVGAALRTGAHGLLAAACSEAAIRRRLEGRGGSPPAACRARAAAPEPAHPARRPAGPQRRPRPQPGGRCDPAPSWRRRSLL